MNCLICDGMIEPKIGWGELFSKEKEQLVCEGCKGKLEVISGETCKICSRPFQNGDLCHDCFRWEEDKEWQGFLDKNISLFRYNDFLREVIARYKFRGDYILAKIFAEWMKPKLLEIKADLIIPIPLSEERLYERGFNQAEALIFQAGFVPENLLTRVHSEKQSKKTRLERIQLPQVFHISAEINLEGKKVVLVDDIYTTGSTLRHAAKILKQGGVKEVLSLTLAR